MKKFVKKNIFSYIYLFLITVILLVINFVNCNDGNNTEHNIFIITGKEASCIKDYIISPWSSFEVDVNCIKFCMNRGCTHCCRSKDSPRDINCLEKAGFFLQGTGEYTRL
uniref:Defensin-like protein n=1 Tax=Strongyloides venezuelensis TaxID=75913 RepID=A0A0K0F8J9_STRVS